MKQNLLKSVLLLCALIAGVTSSRANEFTFNLNELYQNGTKITAKTVIDTKGESLTFTDKNENFTILLTRNSTNQPGFYTSSGYLRFYSSDTFTLSAADGITITKVVITSNGSSFSLSSLDGLDASNKTWTGSAEKVTFTGSGTNKWDKITITYSSGSGGGGDTPTLQDCDLALTGAPIALNFDLYNNSKAQVIHYTTSSTGEVSVESGKYDVSCYVDNDQKTISVTPLAVTNCSQTVTVNQAADNTYKAGSVTFTVTVTDSTPKTGAWELTSLADLEEGDVFVIVGNNYAMTNDNGTSSAPATAAVSIENDEITSDVADNIKWNISGNATDGYTFYPNGDTENWLYCNTTASSSSNNNMRVGTGDRKVFVLDANNNMVTSDNYTARYVSIYNNADWRGYVNTNSAPALCFYKYVDNTAPQKANPELAFSSATAEATFGQDFTPPTLNTAKGFNGTVEYSSSVETVAQVMDTETGELRIVGGGTTVITATFAGDDNFKSGSASYTLTVTDNRVATTITQENITLDVADVATLTQLTPVVKDANDKVVAYTNDPNGEGLPEVYFELVGEDTDGIIGSFDSHGNIILNSVVGTVTIKAVYNQFQINPNYRPSECTFTITVESTLNGIAEFCTLESGNTGKVRLTDAVVLYVNGKDMFVRDNTGAIDFYNTGLSYEAGNILNGKITAKYTLYKNMPELTTPITNNTLVATAGEVVDPIEITPEEAANFVCNLVKFTGVTVTSDNVNFYVDDVQVYDKFKLNYTLEAGKTYDIVGIMIQFNNIYEICPIEAPTEIVAKTATIGTEGYATYVAEGNVSFPDGVQAFIVSGTEGEMVVLEEVAAVPQGTPVILKGDADTYTLSLASEDELSDVTSNMLKASDGTATGEFVYVLAKPENDKVGFYRINEGTFVPAGKAYLEGDGTGPLVKAFFFAEEGETAINNVNVNDNVNNAAIYNIAGQKLSKLQKGINIVNGKKVLF